MGKLVSNAIRMLEKSLVQWKDSCPGAGWEHHQTSAIVSLAMTPAMQELLEMAAIGYAVKMAEAEQRQRVEKSHPYVQKPVIEGAATEAGRDDRPGLRAALEAGRDG